MQLLVQQRTWPILAAQLLYRGVSKHRTSGGRASSDLKLTSRPAMRYNYTVYRVQVQTSIIYGEAVASVGGAAGRYVCSKFVASIAAWYDAKDKDTPFLLRSQSPVKPSSLQLPHSKHSTTQVTRGCHQ